MGISLKNVVVGVFAITGAVTTFACGGTDAQVPDGAIGTDESLLKEGACIGDSMGGATSCKSADTWKEYAAGACKAKGLELSDLSLGGVCKGKGAALTRIDYAEECGKDLYRWTKYECCDATKPPPPPPPPPRCKTDFLGDKTSCKDDAVWKEYAFNYCKDQKAVFGDMSLGDSCGKGMSTGVKVTCCAAPLPPPPPPPPPDTCDWRPLGDPTSCKDPATWKLHASDICAKEGLKLGDIGFPDAKCGPSGETSYIKFSCCK